jgi:hypothetical protein
MDAGVAKTAEKQEEHTKTFFICAALYNGRALKPQLPDGLGWRAHIKTWFGV